MFGLKFVKSKTNNIVFITKQQILKIVIVQCEFGKVCMIFR